MKPILSWPGIHYLARRYGWASLQRAALNARFRSGDWSGFSEPRELIQLVEEHAARGAVLVMGCGVNPIGRALDPNSYHALLGVDLSPEAIQQCRQLTTSPRQYFKCLDMRESGAVPVFTCSAVIFSESLYYLPIPDILPVLQRCRDLLSAAGVVIVTIADPVRYRPVMELIRDNFRIIRSGAINRESDRQVLVFR